MLNIENSPFCQKFWMQQSQVGMLVDIYFLDKGALIIGFADKRPLIQRALFWPHPFSRGAAVL